MGFVDPDLDEASARNISAGVAKRMCLQHLPGKPPVIIQQLRQHIAWRNLLGIIILMRWSRPMWPIDLIV